MQTVILAAGEGTRMRPLTATTPKPMLPVAGQPLVEHTLAGAVDAGASRIILVVGYGATLVREHFGAAYDGIPIEYAVQSEQRGTADAVRAAREQLDRQPFVVLNGDALYDLPSLKTLYESGPAVGAHHVDNPSEYGVLTTDETDHYVTGVIEKPADPPSSFINAGAYAFPTAAYDELDVAESDRGEYELTDVLERICESHSVTPVPIERWLDVGYPWELLSATEWKLENLDGRLDGIVSADATIEGPVVVEDGAEIKAGVTIEGPALIQADATVGPNAYIRGPTVVGPDAHVGHAVEIKHSVLREGATVGHLSYVGDSILGRHVNFGAGTIVANLRHDDEPVELRVKGESISTGRRKFGVVVGDDVTTGINTSLNVGVVLGEGAATTPGESVLTDRHRN